MVQTIRVGAGVYSLLKHISKESKIKIGTLCNLIIVSSLVVDTKLPDKIPDEIKKAIGHDFKSAFNDVMKLKGLEMDKDKTLKEFYESLLP